MESVLRGLAVYFVLLIVFRLSGRRTLAETSSFDLILLLIISETTQQAMVDNDHSFTNALLLIVTLVGASVLLSLVKRRFPFVERLTDGLPVLIARDGRMISRNASRERVDADDVLRAAREQHGLERLDQIRYAVLEADGAISVIPRSD